MRLHLEVRLALALERALPRFFQPGLEARHAETVLARVALKGVLQHTMADSAFKLLRELILIDNSFCVNNIMFDFLVVLF